MTQTTQTTQTTQNEITYRVDYTDTFAGEANYSWLRTARFKAPPDASNTLLVRRGKKALNLTGWPTQTDHWGDMLALRPRDGANVIMFIFVDEENV